MFSDVKPDASKYELDSDKYIVRLARLEATHHEQYGAGVRWVFHFFHRGDPPVAIADANGDKAEFWQTTQPDLTPNSKGGRWASALLGREIQVGESGAKIAEELIGKTGMALYGEKVNPRTKEVRKGIIEITPYTYTKNGQAAPAPAPAPEPVAATADTAEVPF